MVIASSSDTLMAIPSNSYIVLQAYGNEGVMMEAAFALLTLCRQHIREELEAVEVWIYTDKPEFFQSFSNCWLRLNFREVNRELLRQWRGSIDFVHRIKIEVLLDFTATRSGQVLYLDTDVVFTQPVTTIFNDIAAGKLYMHIMEGIVHASDNVMLRKLSAFIKKRGSLQVNGEVISIPEDTTMWNAGLLGFHTQHKHLLNKVLRFTDTVYGQFRKHVVEQFAFSYYFQNAAHLLTAHTTVSHYWNLKEIRSILASYFNYFSKDDWDKLVRFSKLIQLPEPMQQKVNFLQNRSVINKFRKQQWQPAEPRWDLLIQQL